MIFQIGGIILNIQSLNRESFIFKVDDFNALSLTILQIQAAISTLSVSIIAILSGNVSDSYLGITISDFFLEKRPWVMKQKVIIVSEIMSLAVGIVLHIWALYYSVIALFMAALIVIVMSMMQIYSVFNGVRSIRNELEGYVSSLLHNPITFANFLLHNPITNDNAARGLIDDWKHCVDSQTEEDFDKFFDIYMIFVERSLYFVEELKIVNELGANIVRFLLESDSQKCKIWGIKFVSEYYRRIWLWINQSNQNKRTALTIKSQVHLIDRVDYELYWAIDSLPAEVVERVLDWNVLSEMVIRVSAWIGYDSRDGSSEADAVIVLGKYFGDYINKQNKKGNVVNNKRWETFIGGGGWRSAYGIPKKSQFYFEEKLEIRDFNVCRGYILSGQVGLVTNGLFLDEVGNIYRVENSAYLLKVLSVHCYMYYLAFRESTNCVDEEVQKSVKAALLQRDVVNSMRRFIDIACGKSSFFSGSLLEKMSALLEKNELFPEHSNGKIVVITGAVSDYYLFVALMMYGYPYQRGKLTELISGDKFFDYLLGTNSHKTLMERFSELMQLFYSDYSEDKRERSAEEMVATFKEVARANYKKKLIEDAARSQAKYEEENLQDEEIERIKQVVIDNFKALFDGIFNTEMRNEPGRKYKKVRIFSSIDYTQSLGKNDRYLYSSYPFGNFVNWLAVYLVKRYGLDVVDRNKVFSNDEEFRKYLDGSGFDVLMGSQYVFDAKDYSQNMKHQEYLDSKKTVLLPSDQIGIAASEGIIDMCLKDVVVEIRSPEAAEMGAIKNAKTGLLSYSPITGVSLDFEDDEFSKYVHDERKVIEVFFEVYVGITKHGKNKGLAVIKREI